MAVYGWIRSNLNVEGNQGDYLVRFCSPELKEYKDILWKLSNRMLSTQNRNLDEEKQKQRTWFAGYLDKKHNIYTIALSGEQEDILNIEYSKREESRGLYSVLVLVFTEEEAKKKYRKDDNIFKPLKDIIIEIINNKEIKISNRVIEQDFSEYVDEINSNDNYNDYNNYNIMQSSEDLDLKLWNLSQKRTIITGALSKSDGIKLLSLFPDAIITVSENISSQKISPIVYDNNKTKNKENFYNKENTNNRKIFENSNDINYIFSEENIKKSFELVRKSITKAISTMNNENQILNEKISEDKKLFYIKEISELCKSKLSKEQILHIEKSAQKIKLHKDKHREQIYYFAYMYYYDKKFENVEFILKNWTKQFKKFGEVLDSNYYMALRIYNKNFKDVR